VVAIAARYCTDSFVLATILAPPSTLAAAPNVGGGSFAAATYFWKITGSNSRGETTASNEATTAVALNGTCTLTWAALPAGTTAVKVYRGTVTNTENVLVATLGAVVTYTDTGIAGVAGSPPAVSGAEISSILTHAGALRDSAHPAVTANPNAFATVAPVAGQGHVSGPLLQYLAVHPSGPEF
jgi:hypothetical protein